MAGEDRQKALDLYKLVAAEQDPKKREDLIAELSRLLQAMDLKPEVSDCLVPKH
jgi:hypothetical protein